MTDCHRDILYCVKDDVSFSYNLVTITLNSEENAVWQLMAYYFFLL